MAIVGVVCEGSHDFYFLSEIVDEMLVRKGQTGNQFHALQPKVDATSRQVDGGGYESVRQWTLTNSGVSLRNFFSPVLFSTSVQYDVIIIQIDGDVADICSDFIASPFNAVFPSVSDRVSAVRSWLLCNAKIEPRFADRVIAAIPTLQMEAWVISGIHPTATNVEDRSRKKAAKRLLRKRYLGSALDQVKAAGKDARSALQAMKSKSQSFQMFADDFEQKA